MFQSSAAAALSYLTGQNNVNVKQLVNFVACSPSGRAGSLPQERSFIAPSRPLLLVTTALGDGAPAWARRMGRRSTHRERSSRRPPCPPFGGDLRKASFFSGNSRRRARLTGGPMGSPRISKNFPDKRTAVSEPTRHRTTLDKQLQWYLTSSAATDRYLAVLIVFFLFCGPLGSLALRFPAFRISD